MKYFILLLLFSGCSTISQQSLQQHCASICASFGNREVNACDEITNPNTNRSAEVIGCIDPELKRDLNERR